MAVRTPPSLSGEVRTRRLSVIVRDVRPPRPNPGTMVEVVLDGNIIVPGRVIQILGWDVIRVGLDG